MLVHSIEEILFLGYQPEILFLGYQPEILFLGYQPFISLRRPKFIFSFTILFQQANKIELRLL